jgi:predicted metal-dependent hydrolase
MRTEIRKNGLHRASPVEDPPVSERAPRSIPVRRPSFEFERVRERHWFGGDAFQTHLLHALSLTFPEGERFFMDAVRHYLPRVTSPALRHEISRFLAQEGMHGLAHEAFNEWVRSLGNDTEAIEAEVRDDLARARREASPRYCLAVTCALEHFTAILAELLLADEELRNQLPPEIRSLWVWHAIEETEHKAVAFDTYVETGGTYRMRVLAMVFTTFGFIFRVGRDQARLLRADPEASAPFAVVRGLARMWIWPGNFLPVIPAYLDYFRPGFHPWQRAPRKDFAAFRDALNAIASNGAA